MELTIESIFKQKEVNTLCEEIAKEYKTYHKITLLMIFIFCGSALYGFTMGLQTSLLQAAASSIKVFVLFFFTLVVCLPTLHFIGLLFGAKTKFVQITLVLLTGMAITSILLGAFAPISLFFLLSGMRYELLLIMHVFIFACCGAAGLLSVKRNMTMLRKNLSLDENDPDKNSEFLLKIWFLLYMFVGTQMSYLLAPFIRAPQGFLFMNNQEGDFYSYLFQIIRNLLY
jgi:hypothetical protein